MEIKNRIEKLTSFLANANEVHTIDSKKKLHKLIYLLQANGEEFDQDFIFHYYGVFSPTLAQDIDIAQEKDLVRIKEPNDGQWAYSIRLTESSTPNTELISSTNKALLTKLALEDAQLLEVLSTIVYLFKNYYKGEDLVFKLKELKPKLERYYDRAFELALEHFNISI